MGLDIRRLDRLRTGRTGTGSAEKTRKSDLPLDHQLSFNPNPGEEWKYRNGHIYINDLDVNELVNNNGSDIGLLSGISFGLDEYKNYVWDRGGYINSKFNGAVGALQEKIIGRLGSIYEGLTGGVHYEYAGGAFWINNVNVQAVLTLYRIRPTTKARSYLRGLRDKLFLIIARKQSSPRSDGIYDVVSKLIEEIDGAIEDNIPTDTPLLVADTRA